MLGQTSASPLIDELRPKGDRSSELASQSSFDPADLPNALGASSSMLSGIRSKRLLPALGGGASTPRRAARAPSVGILLYLLSVGIIAAATVSVFFGIGFFLLVPPMVPMSASAGGVDHGDDIKPRLPAALSNAFSANSTVPSIPIEPKIPRSAATAALPVVRPAPAAGRPSPIGDVPASDSKDQSFGKGESEPVAREVSPTASALAAPTAEPGSSAAVPAPEEAPRLSAAQITELLARGDTFLRAGDIASARVFYERAADAGDEEAAMRMGASFDPTFLGRTGLRTRGDPTKAQSWYRHALDLGAPEANRQAQRLETK